MVKIADISSTVFRGLNISVLAGVSKGVLNMSSKMFGTATKRRKRRKRKRS